MSITIVITFITLTYLTYITPADITAAIVKSVAVASVFIGISIAVMSCYSLKRYHKVSITPHFSHCLHLLTAIVLGSDLDSPARHLPSGSTTNRG